MPFPWLTQQRESSSLRGEDVTEHIVVDDRVKLARADVELVGATLTVLRGQNVGQVHWLKPGANILGRAPSAEITIQVTGVSRHHAQVLESGGVYQLQDLESTNGTFVGGKLVSGTVELRTGDQINLGGQALLRFALEVGRRDSGQTPPFEAATRDRLTSARSLRAFQEQLASEWVWTQRPVRSCAMMLLDVEDLEALNQRHGHAAGDFVLREVARRITVTAGTDHALGRFLGGTFALLCRAIDRNDAIDLAKALIAQVAAEPLIWKNEALTICLSIGVASSDDANISGPDDLLAAASQQLTLAKSEGSNRIAF